MGEYMLMPKLDMSMKEGTIVSWLVREGQYLNKGEYAVEVETGKVSIEVDNTAFSGKVLRIYCEEGETVEVNMPIMYIGNDGDEIPGKEDALEYFKVLKRENSRLATAHDFDYDVLIIGAGQAGYSFALNASKYTDRIAVAEKSQFGGVCLNRGCIPSRFYHKRAAVANSVRYSDAYGIASTLGSVDFAGMAESKNSMTFKLSQSVKHNLNSLCDVYEGDARICAPHLVKCAGEYVSAKYIVIATGSHSMRDEIRTDGSVPVYDTEEMISVSHLPEKIVFFGNSRYIIEQAYLFSSFGSDVVLVTDMNVTEDNYINRQIKKSLARVNVKIINEELFEIKDGVLITEKGHRYPCDVFVSESRRAANKTDSEIPFEYDENGFYVCDDSYRTNIEDVYVIGDACGKSLTAQGAGLDAQILAEILFVGAEPDARIYPQCINLSPRIAFIGKSEKELEAEGVEFVSAKRSFSSIPAAMASAEEGFLKIICDSRFGEIVSVQIMCDNADELLGIFTTAISEEMTVDELAGNMFIHPSLSELTASLCAELKEKISDNL